MLVNGKNATLYSIAECVVQDEGQQCTVKVYCHVWSGGKKNSEIESNFIKNASAGMLPFGKPKIMTK